MKLEIKAKERGGYRLTLDGMELSGVKEYSVKSLKSKGKAELSLIMLVDFPPSQDQEIFKPADYLLGREN